MVKMEQEPGQLNLKKQLFCNWFWQGSCADVAEKPSSEKAHVTKQDTTIQLESVEPCALTICDCI